MSNSFPLGIATGNAFCNRQSQRQALAHNFNQITHSLLISPRRYGKTSLIMQSILDEKLTSEKIDFFSTLDLLDAQKRILEGVSSLIGKLTSKAELALKMAKEFFANFSLSLSYKEIGFSLSLKPQDSDVSKSIRLALSGLEALAKKRNKKIVLFFDELQAIHILGNKSLIVEGAIREIAQMSRNVAYVFSGSNRHMLNQIFNDRSRPLYQLCHRINIDRIDATAYNKHLQKSANAKWGRKLNENIIDAILTTTERHPYYVNALCARLWQQNAAPNSVDTIQTNWLQYAAEEQSRVSTELEQLSTNQQKLLINIARIDKIKEPTNQAFLQLSKLSSASILQALKALIQKDYLMQDENAAYQLIDPMIKTVLKKS